MLVEEEEVVVEEEVEERWWWWRRRLWRRFDCFRCTKRGHKRLEGGGYFGYFGCFISGKPRRKIANEAVGAKEGWWQGRGERESVGGGWVLSLGEGGSSELKGKDVGC